MTGFTAPVDIGNRALNHLGGRAITSFSDGSRNATVLGPMYDKLRQAELRRNLWRFATRKAALRALNTTTMQLVPNAYDPLVSYYPGDIVTYLSAIWLCLQFIPSGVVPVDANGVVSPLWDNYFGPMTVDVWVNPAAGAPPQTLASGTFFPAPSAYHAGEIVYIAPGNGTFSAFVSLIDGNTDDPLGPDAWNASQTYMASQIVLGSDTMLYESMVSLNAGNDPTITFNATAWASGTTYAAGDYVYDTNDQIFQSNAGGNLGNALSYNSTFWTYTGMWAGVWTMTLAPQPRATSNNWHYLSCSLQPINLIYPVGAGPLAQSNSLNAFMLPNNYLHQAPTDNKKGTVPWVGGPAGILPDDWIFQGKLILSASVGPILIRFVSDFQDVTQMDPMFCEGLSARLAHEACEIITQALDKQQICTAAYRTAMGEARTINAIEVGPISPPIDDWILVRQ